MSKGRAIAKTSGANRGKGGYATRGPAYSVSPICNPVALTRPMMSPGYASSMVSRSEPNAVVAYFVPTVLPVRAQDTSMARSKCPEHTRANAKRSLWLGSMLACTLNTNAEKSLSNARSAPESSTRGAGAGARSTAASNNIRTPKLVSAEPTNTGVVMPARKLSDSTFAPMASSKAQPSRAAVHDGPSSWAARVASTSSSGAADEPPLVRVNRM